jgi:phosphoribosyl 1,2-cyclic phosphate phosphodiesterase
MTAYKAFEVDGAGGPIQVLPMNQQHGSILSLSFRFGDFTYSTDTNDFPKETVEHLQGTKIWVIDALRFNTHKTHFNVEAALRWIDRIKPERAYLTNMHHDLDYEALKAMTPAHVEPAYDGLKFDITP